MNRRVIILDKPGKKEVVVPLSKRGEKVEVLGLVLGKEKGEYELVVTMDHKVGRTKGRVEVRGVAQNGAKVKVSGMIRIDKNCRQVDDFLEIRLLLLDDKSWATVEPRLEIESNEVKASHAATVSKVNEKQLSYLANRGIERVKAKEVIVEGFLKEITDKIKGDV
jgi:Fe-S cluster assembly scaffold protein SufB